MVTASHVKFDVRLSVHSSAGGLPHAPCIKRIPGMHMSPQTIIGPSAYDIFHCDDMMVGSLGRRMRARDEQAHPRREAAREGWLVNDG